MEPKEYYAFKKQLKYLASLRGQGTELISIYIPPGYNVIEVTNKLREEAGQAANIKSKQTRKNVQGAIDRLLHALTGFKAVPENGIAFFAGNLARETGGEKIELFSIVPPEPITIQTYRCDSHFFLEPLFEMTQPKELYGLLTLDRREAAIALLKGKKLQIVKSMTSRVPGKVKAGGQSALRYERLTEIAAHEWFKKVGELANKTFGPENVKHIVIGGSGPTKSYFVNGDYLQNAVKAKIAGIIDTGYTDEVGINEMIQKIGGVVRDLDITKEKNIVNEFLKEAAISGLATYGLEEVGQALDAGKVRVLLLSEELEWSVFSFKCPQCGAQEKKTAKQEPELACPKCGTQMKCEQTLDLVEELSERAQNLGAETVMISTDTPEGKQFASGFGGIGALLRFK